MPEKGKGNGRCSACRVNKNYWFPHKQNIALDTKSVHVLIQMFMLMVRMLVNKQDINQERQEHNSATHGGAAGLSVNVQPRPHVRWIRIFIISYLSSAFYRQIHTFCVKSLLTSSIFQNHKAKESLILWRLNTVCLVFANQFLDGRRRHGLLLS